MGRRKEIPECEIQETIYEHGWRFETCVYQGSSIVVEAYFDFTIPGFTLTADLTRVT